MQSNAFRAKKLVMGILVLCLASLLALPQAAADDSGVFISIRIFDGVDPEDRAEIARHSEEGFLPILQASDGFLAYYVAFTDTNEAVAINFFLTPEEAAASNEMARDFVAENMAPLLPNPPRIIEGSVDIGAINFQERDTSGMHASVRVYDGYVSDDHEELVSRVEDGFLPIMLETDGFAAYYLMTDGAGALVAISLFDSEASALASNEKARDFVAENLAAFLPEDPAISSGRASIAFLNVDLLAAEVLDLPVFISIRLYDGLDPANLPAMESVTRELFVPIIRESEGFLGYYLTFSDEGELFAVSLFETREQALASNEQASEFHCGAFCALGAQSAADRGRRGRYRLRGNAGRHGAWR